MSKEELTEKVKEALDNVRPYLNRDGGDVILKEITDDMIVKVQFTGACTDCAFSYHTLKAGIEMSIKNLVPDIKEVESV